MKLITRTAVLASTLALFASAGIAEDKPAEKPAAKSSEAATTGTATAAPSTASAASAGKMIDLPGGTKYVDEKVGTGAEAVAGKQVTVHYTGTLTNGKKFDSSRDRNEPFKFQLGAGMVIKGWDAGVAGMKVGGKRKLTIPPDQAYGSRSMGPDLPANSTLLFDVELLGVN